MSKRNPLHVLMLKILAGVALFAVANLLVYQHSGYFERARRYHAVVDGFGQRRQATMIILGDSHAAQLPNRILSTSVYNAAMGGDALRECYAKLRYLLQHHPSIDTVLLSADPHMFARIRQESSNRAFVDRYLLSTGSPYGLQRGRVFAVMNSVPLFNDEFVQYLHALIPNRMRSTAAPRRSASVAWSQRTEAERVAAATRAGTEDHAGIGDFPDSLEWYARIQALAKAHGARVLLVRYPVHPDYLRGIPAQKLRQLDTQLAALGFPQILDFSSSLSAPEHFSDPDHVNGSGALALLPLVDRGLASLSVSARLERSPD